MAFRIILAAISFLAGATLLNYSMSENAKHKILAGVATYILVLIVPIAVTTYF